MNRFLFFLLIAFLSLASITYSQNIFMFVAGKSVPASNSGDTFHRYEYRVTADSGAQPASFVIYDAGLGSKADVIADGDTKTTFQLFSATTMQQLQTLTAGSEQKFQHRWFPFAILNPSSAPKGWIVRVSTSDGNDINAFKFDIMNSSDSSLLGKLWHITSSHLTIALTGLNESAEVQVRLRTSQKKSLAFSLSGKTALHARLRNSFGLSSSLTTSSEFLNSYIAGINNECGLIISGVSNRLNTFVIENKNDSSVVWELNPIIIEKQRATTMNTVAQSGSGANSVILSLADATKKELPDASPIWIFGKTIVTGNSAPMQFAKPGNYNIKVLVPAHGIYFPQYFSGECKVHIAAPPVAVISGAEDNIAPGTALNLSARNSSDPEKHLLHYQWFVNNEFRGAQPTIRFSNSLPGNYEIRLVVDNGTSNAASSTSSTTKIIHINAQPYAEISAPRIIARSTQVKFLVKNEFDSDGDDLKFTWTGAGIFGDVHGRSVTVKHEQAGNYQMTLLVDDQSGTENATYSTTVTYQVNADPVSMFKLPERAAVGEEILLAPIKQSENKNLSYHWKISDGNELKSEEASLSFDTPGDYQVSLIVDDGEGVENSVQTFTRTLHINAPPVIVWNVPANIALGDTLVLNASQSYDRDGSIIEYEWKFDDKIIGKAAVVSLPTNVSGKHAIALRITDNSGTSSRSVSKTTSVRINSKPSPVFTLPASVFEGETISLVPGKLIDQDVDTLNFLWNVDGTRSDGKSVSFTAGNHSITLIADDRRGLHNSIDSLRQTLYVVPKPNLQSLEVPKDWLIGSEISISSITNVSHIGFVMNGKILSSIRIDTAGQQFITLGWAPHTDVLTQERFAIQAWQPLEFVSKVEPQKIPWHPANPTTVLTAPNVNRPDTRKVKFEWRSGSTLIGSGKVVEVPLKAGKNIFTVQAIDQDMLGARSASMEIVVNCE
ncbi:MAG TPA: PKD domain-containing protein [Bacteroidota bacterium]|nr:PKD domain-containing protein [Bacteroidota bacterium]